MHPIRLSGLVIGAQQTFEYFQRMQDRVVDFIVRTSKSSKETVNKYMNATGNMANDVGTILYGKEAVEIGLIDQVGGLQDALAKLKDLIKEQESKNVEIK
jgi:ATP-dependent protease ClpP protease subunit